MSAHFYRALIVCLIAASPWAFVACRDLKDAVKCAVAMDAAVCRTPDIDEVLAAAAALETLSLDGHAPAEGSKGEPADDLLRASCAMNLRAPWGEHDARHVLPPRLGSRAWWREEEQKFADKGGRHGG